MASNSFGNIFKITTWGESHGKAIGVVIDGCPAGVPLTAEEINQELSWRSPGKMPWTSPRQELDRAEILSGLFEGQTTGAPISIIIWNQDVQSSAYEPIKNHLRPGHAHYTYLEKYGVFDYRGGGRASARETACRVAAGAVAKKMLSDVGVEIVAFIRQIGSVGSNCELSDVDQERGSLSIYRQTCRASPLFCPDPLATESMIRLLQQNIEEGDSLGGVVEAIAVGVPPGWGDPIYEKLEALLAQAMLSIPASKGFEIGSGLRAAEMRGSQHNDPFYLSPAGIKTRSNQAGGTLAGISTGMPLVVRVPFKPTSSIRKSQETVDIQGQQQILKLPPGSRHDPCVAIRAVPVVEAMMALVLVDVMLMNRLSRV